MSGPYRQLAFDLPLGPRFGREDFLVSTSNETAVETIDLWPRWPDPVLVLVGPEGAGKSHLGAIWAARARASMLQATHLATGDLPDLVGGGAVLIEDADHIGPAEAALFHFLNMARERGTFALLTARRLPDHWGLATPDLLSRLRLAPLVAIGAPDDALLRAVLVKLIADRQLAVEAGVIDFVARHIERSLAAARAAVAALDAESLAQGRPITKSLAAAVLKGKEGE